MNTLAARVHCVNDEIGDSCQYAEGLVWPIATMTTDATFPRILPCGDAAATVEFGEVIDADLNAQVLALDTDLEASPIAGVVETVPTYRSLLIHYDLMRTGFSDLKSQLLNRIDKRSVAIGKPSRTWRIPVVYGGEYGVDLTAVAERHGIVPDEVVARHTAGDYRVAMLGFTAGFCYLSGLDPSIATPRRDNPRQNTPAGTISIGGAQAAVQCLASPSGWHLLGRTPVRSFHPERDPVFLIEPGDAVSFFPIDAHEWDLLDRAAAGGEPVAELLTR